MGAYDDCREDVDHRCDGGPEVDGEPTPCARCVEYAREAEAYFRRSYDAATPYERLAVTHPERAREEYEADMRDAGRWVAR